MQDTAEVVAGLEEITALLRFSGQPKFKLKAYQHAAEVVKTLGHELGPLVEQGRLRELPGIGATLARQIEELWNTGSSDYLTRLRSEHPQGAAELIQVEGLTPRRIRALDAALGVHSVTDLRAACAAGQVRKVPGFGEKTEARLAASCERWLERTEPAERRVLIVHALEIAESLVGELRESGIEVELAGDLRRGEETVTEIELVVRGEREPVLGRLAQMRRVIRVDSKAGVAHLAGGVIVSVRAADDDLGNALVLATGNAAHVRAVHERAAARGFALSRVEGAGAPAARAFSTEAELYRALGVAFVPPELREGRGELDEAARGDFDDLVELTDVQGLVHCHTNYSDGKQSVLEMAEAAHALGMKYITITDHSPSAHYARGVTLDRLARQWDEIQEARESVPISVLAGTESDIGSDGLLDFPDSVIERFDVVIASIHARHRMDRAAMTRRLERAMALPIFKIWGHALGRIINHRPPIDCDVEAVLDALAGSRGAVEINADPHRLDLPPAWIPAARARRIPFVISVDAHSTRGFSVLPLGVTMARRGGLRRDEVLNTRPAQEFAALVRPR